MAYGLDPTSWGLLILVGCIAGFCAGLLGIGGGFIVVPALMSILPHLGVAAVDIPKITAATSLGLIIPTSIASAQAHIQKAGIDWGLCALLTPGIVTGAIAAATFANNIDARVVSLMFMGVALLFAAQLLRGRGDRGSHPKKEQKINVVGITIKTVAGGFASALLGLGVAFFCVPILSRFISIPKAIGTASALGLPLALAGIATHLLTNPSTGCGPTCAGYIFLPALAAIGLTSVLTAPLGAKATQVLPVHTLQRLFAFILVIAAGHIAFKTLAPGSLMADAKMLVAEIIVKPWRGENPMPAEPYFEMHNGEKSQARVVYGAQ